MKKIILGVLIMNSINLNSGLNIPKYKNIEFKPKRPQAIELPNKIKLYIEEDNTLPIIKISLLMRGGRVIDPADKTGLGELFFEVWREGGSRKYTPDEIEKTLDYYAAEINSKINTEDASVSMISHKNSFDKIFDIFIDLIKNPAFDTKKFEIKKAEVIEMIKRRNDKPDRQATREALRMFFGKDHPYGRRSEIETVNKITRNDLIYYHSSNFVSSNMTLVVAGNFDKNEMIEKIIKNFSDISYKEYQQPKIEIPQIPTKRKIYVIDKPIRQSYVVMLMEGPKRHDDIEYPLAVLSEYMGGGIQSVLGNEIRSKRGLAYSVYSYFGKRDVSGFILTYLGTKPESVSEAIKQIIYEKEKVKKGEISEKELNMAKSQIINSFIFRFPTTFNLLEEFAGYEQYGYPPHYLENYTSKINSVTKEDTINTAKKLYNTDKALIFIVGDAKKFLDQIREFGEVEILKED